MDTNNNEIEIPSSALLEECDMCIHSIAKTDCKTCKYKCEHGRRKYTCKECGGSSICIHNREKSLCKECGGASICIHNKQRTRCKECGGGSICEHDREKSTCKECGGSSICEHGRRKSECKECGGSQICIHNKFKSTCKECGGSKICIHNRQKSTCNECCGSQICIHDKLKSRCKECGGSALCKSNFCETIKNSKYNGYCTRCYIHLFPDEPISINYKTKEYAVLEFIRKTYPEHTWINDKKIDGGCSKKRPDIFLDLLTHSIIIEIDENQHRSYDNCEIKRINLLFEDLGDRHIIFIRFNPDDYIDKDNNKITSCWGINKNGLSSVKKSKRREWSNRLNTLKNIVDKYLNIDEIDVTEPITNQHLFYDEIEYDDEDDGEDDEE